ncbi:MAG: AAA family ATPase [Rhodospirillaceae bacterium]|nr:AAA family ATPase [Rhodospirillaceae bacterium]
MTMIELTERHKLKNIYTRSKQSNQPLDLFPGLANSPAIGIILGKAKIRKSMMGMMAGFAATGAVKFLGKTVAGKPRQVLYIDFELSENGFGARAVRMLKDDNLPDGFYRVEGTEWIDPFEDGILIGKKLNAAVYQKLEATIRKYCIDLVIIDPLYMLLEDENDNGSMKRVLAGFRVIVNKTKCDIIIIHHIGKEKSVQWDDPFSVARGASSLGGFVDWVFAIEGRHNNQAVLHLGARYFEASDPIPMRFCGESLMWLPADDRLAA